MWEIWVNLINLHSPLSTFQTADKVGQWEGVWLLCMIKTQPNNNWIHSYHNLVPSIHKKASPCRYLGLPVKSLEQNLQDQIGFHIDKWSMGIEIGDIGVSYQ